MGIALRRRAHRAARRRGSTAASLLPISAANPNPTVTSTGGPPNIDDVQINMPHDGQPHQGFPGLIYLGSGRLIAVYRSGARHSLTVRGTTGHGVILLAESLNYGETWSVRTIVDSAAMDDDRDPNITILPNATWLLTYPTWLGPDNATQPPTGCVINLRTSTDQGVTWSAETRVNPTSASLTTYPGLSEYLATTSPVLVASDGSYVIPATGRKLAGQVDYSSFMLRSSTLAGPWTATLIGDGPTDARSYDEPYARKLSDGTYLAFSRHGGDKVARYTSADGITWGALTVALNGGGGGRPSFTQLANGTIIMGTRGSETQNQVRLSRDKGVSWSGATDIPPVALRLATYQAHVEVSPNLIACVYAKEDTLENGRAYFRYLFDGVEGVPPATLTLVSKTTAVSTSSNNTGSVPTPASVQVGDLLILTWNQRNTTATFTAPSGFVSLGSQAGTGKLQIWYKIADGTEGSTLTVTSSGNAGWTLGCMRLTGASSSAPTALFSTASASTTATTPAATISNAGALVIAVWAGGNANVTDVVSPADYTEQFDIKPAATSTNPFLVAASKFPGVTGTEPGASVTVPSQTWMAASVVVNPA